MVDRILVGVDNSEGSRQALAWAIEDAAFRGAAVEAVAVWRGADSPDMSLEFRSFPSIGGHDRAVAERTAQLLAQAVSESASAHPQVTIETTVVEGDPTEVLCRRAEQADLLVVGSRGHGGFGELLLGSVASKCAHHSPRPLVIVPRVAVGLEEPRSDGGLVIVGIDASKGSLRALRWAIDEAVARGWRIQAATVWTRTHSYGAESDWPGGYWPADNVIEELARSRLTTAIEGAVGAEPVVKVEPLVLEGDPGERLCAVAAGADLLVVGSRGHGTLSGLLLGSVSDKCARHSPRPVAIIHEGK